MAHSGTLEARHARVQKLTAVVPYVLLATSAALSWFAADHSVQRNLITSVLALLSAVWLWFAGTRREPGPVFVAGLIVCIAVLGLRDVWFSTFFAFAGYLYSWSVLHGGWRFVGVTATAAITAAAVVGGVPELSPVGVLTYLLLVAVIVALVSLFSMLGDITGARSASYERMVARLEEKIRENTVLQSRLLAQARDAGMHEERQRLAREIHDTLAQSIVGIVTQLQAAKRAGVSGQGEVWRHHLDHATRLARESLAEARRSVHALTPGQLDSAQLPEAVATVADHWRRDHDVWMTVSTTGDVRSLHRDADLALLRVLQEALTNVAAHAAASRVGVTLSYMHDQVSLDVRDDGVGFDDSQVGDRGGYGLTSMRQRVTRLGGVLEIESAPGAGTAISACVPAVSTDRSLEGADV